MATSNNTRSPEQFSKAGEYEVSKAVEYEFDPPKFLLNNAWRHDWAFGAIARLLDYALIQASYGATYVNVDVLDNKNKKDGSKMLLVEDNGGGMIPEKMEYFMSCVVEQHMRLGADVIVFSSCGTTRSIGCLRSTRKKGKATLVPMLFYEKRKVDEPKTKMLRSSRDEQKWNKSMETVLECSPFESEKELDEQFHKMSGPNGSGTRIIIYNLWEIIEGQNELDFDTDCHDIQLPDMRDEKNVQMAKLYRPNSLHFLNLTYRHSLRSYASILYLHVPSFFRIILRGKDVEQHNVLNDLMLSERAYVRYKDGTTTEMVVKAKLGFLNDAKNHLDVQGFNVYHRNRLIMPFWRVSTRAAGSEIGRGVIGVIKADFIKPAHTKQGFEQKKSLDRLEQELKEMQNEYWWKNYDEYARWLATKRSLSVSDSPSPPHKSQKVSNIQIQCYIF